MASRCISTLASAFTLWDNVCRMSSVQPAASKVCHTAMGWVHPALERSTAQHGIRCSPAVLLPVGLVRRAQPKQQMCCGWLLLLPLLRHCRCRRQRPLPLRAGWPHQGVLSCLHGTQTPTPASSTRTLLEELGRSRHAGQGTLQKMQCTYSLHAHRCLCEVCSQQAASHGSCNCRRTPSTEPYLQSAASTPVRGPASCVVKCLWKSRPFVVLQNCGRPSF